jgi:hypothetical protein
LSFFKFAITSSISVGFTTGALTVTHNLSLTNYTAHLTMIGTPAPFYTSHHITAKDPDFVTFKLDAANITNGDKALITMGRKNEYWYFDR